MLRRHERKARWARCFSLIYCIVSSALIDCQRLNSVNPDAAVSAGAKFWQLLQTNDVSTAMDRFDPSSRRASPGLYDRWSKLLEEIGSKYGPVASAELLEKKWFPGSSLVPDHRASFICYAYAYKVKRPTLVSDEQLIICGDSGAPDNDMHVYAHEMRRQDSQQVVRIGIDRTEKSR